MEEIKNINFKVDNSLGEKANKILELSEEYFKYKDNEVLAFALINALKPYRDSELIDLIKNPTSDIGTIEMYLLGKKKYAQTNADILKSAQEYVDAQLHDSCKISFSERKKAHHVVLRKFVGVTFDEFCEIFLVNNTKAKELERRSFITNFVDTYMKNHVRQWINTYLEKIDYSWLKITYLPTEQFNNWISFDIEFAIDYEDLTSKNMKNLEALFININLYIEGLF